MMMVMMMMMMMTVFIFLENITVPKYRMISKTKKKEYVLNKDKVHVGQLM